MNFHFRSQQINTNHSITHYKIFLYPRHIFSNTLHFSIEESISHLKHFDIRIERGSNKMSKSWLKKFNLQYWTSPYFTNIPSLQVKTSTASDQLRICASWTLFICFSRYADSYFSVASLWWLQNCKPKGVILNIGQYSL